MMRSNYKLHPHGMVMFAAGLLMLLASAGCSQYVGDFQYVPYPAVRALRVPANAQAPNLYVLASVIGVRRADAERGLPQSLEIHLRLENNGSEPVTFDSAMWHLTNGHLIAFANPITAPPGRIAVPPAAAQTITAYFPIPAGLDIRNGLLSLELQGTLTANGQTLQATINFRRVYPAYYSPYWYGPGWYYPYPYPYVYPSWGWRGAVIIRRR